MKTQLKAIRLSLPALLGVCLLHPAFCLRVEGQNAAFTYQGRLNDGANPANGIYDLRFAIYDAASAGAQHGVLLTNSATAISNGLFTVTLDFGNQFPGADRWLEIAVRTNGGGAFTTLAPRQALTPTPYAVHAASAATATTAASAGSVPAANLTGTIPLAQLPAGIITNGASGLNLSGTFSGSFGNVTNLNLSKSGPVGGGVNRFRFTDATGSEQVYLHAARNMDLETVNDATFWAGHDFTAVVDHDFIFHAKHDDTVTVDNNLGLAVGAGLSATVGNSFSLAVGNNLNIAAGHNFTIEPVAGVGLGTANPQSSLHVYSANNPTVVRVQSTGTPGFGRLEFVSNPQGDFNEWRPGYIQSTDSGNFTGGLAFFVNGTGGANKFGSNEVMRVVNGAVGINTTTPQTALDVNGEVKWGNGSRLSADWHGGLELGSPSLVGNTPFLDFHYGVGSGQDYNTRIINDGNECLSFYRASSATPMARFTASGLTVNGTFVSASDRNLKENFQPVDVLAVLNKVAALPVSRWNYKDDQSQQHLGPMAQDFYAAFGVGPDDKHIATVDEGGVALAAIQGLNQKLEQKETEIAELKARLERLEQLLTQTAK